MHDNVSDVEFSIRAHRRSVDSRTLRERVNNLAANDAALYVVDMPQLLRAADLAQDEGEAVLAVQFIEAIYTLFDESWGREAR